MEDSRIKYLEEYFETTEKDISDKEKLDAVEILLNRAFPTWEGFRIAWREKKRNDDFLAAHKKIVDYKIHIDEVHKGNTDECIDEGCMKLDMDEYKGYVKTVADRLIEELKKQIEKEEKHENTNNKD